MKWKKQEEWRHSARGYSFRFLERAKLRTPDSDLTYNFIFNRVREGACELTGINFDFINLTNYYHNPYAPSIDRINPKIGYYCDNVQFILSWLNRAKGEYDQEMFIKMMKFTSNLLTLTRNKTND